MGKREISNTVADPTLPKTPVEIDGKTFNLCFDLGALAEAEMYFNQQFARQRQLDKHFVADDVNLLRALPELNLSNVRIIFPCAAHKFQPTLGFAEGQSLITLKNVYAVASAIASAWQEAVPEAETKTETENPPIP
jgi:hypothetical protein